MSAQTRSYSKGDWYNLPAYYDAIFDQDSKKEADFLETIWDRFGGGARSKRSDLRILEPACGSGRLVCELAKRGHLVEGFDANPRMIESAQRKLDDRRLRAKLGSGRMESMPARGRYDLIHCLLSTFKYVRTERDARCHLGDAAAHLVRGGLYVLGIHLTDYGRNRADREHWTGTGNGFAVSCETTTFPPDPRRRTEKLRNRLQIKFHKVKGQKLSPAKLIETRWLCRTYNAAQLQKLLGKLPQLECVACFDFNYDLELQRELDDNQEDIVLILRKR